MQRFKIILLQLSLEPELMDSWPTMEITLGDID